MTRAEQIMQRLNPNALICPDEGGAVAMIEDVTDPEGRFFRIEYRSTPDGKKAVAFCRHNPWGAVNGGESYQAGHVDGTGFICLGSSHSGQELADSPYDIEFVIPRARFWCTAFSVLKETGQFPLPEPGGNGHA